MKQKAILLFLFLSFNINNLVAIDFSSDLLCPSDRTISCCQDYDNLDITGDPAVNNPDVNYFTKVDSTDLTECRVGLIKRIWTGHFPGNQSSCVQYITMKRENPFNGNINWPADWAGHCGDEIPYSEPEYDIGFCDQIGHTFKDDTFRFVDDACVKILRNWKIIDWCVYKPNSGSNDGIIKYTQVFMIIDQIAPEVQECSNKIISATNQNCSASFTLSKNADDENCSQNSPLKWYFELDLNNDWQIDTTGSINSSTANLELFNIPIGTHKIKWSVFDGCGNVNTCMETIKVVDAKPPTLYCYLSTTFNLTPVPGKDTLDYAAKNFVKDAYDNCTDKDDIIFSFSPDPKDSVKTFTCFDLGFQFFRIYAIDKQGNSDFALVLARVDMHGQCTFNSIQGSLTSFDSTPIKNIDINLNGNGRDYIVGKTQSDGTFSFPYKENQIKARLKFSMNNNSRPNLKANSMRKIINYLLGREKLTKIEKFAADLNNDNKVSISDIVIYRKLLLGRLSYNEIKDPIKFFIKDKNSKNGYKEIEYIDEYNENIDVKCVMKGML